MSVNMKRKGVNVIDGVVYVENVLINSLRVDEDPTPSDKWDDPVYTLLYRPMRGVCQAFKGLNESELIDRILDLTKGEPKKPHVVYSLIAKVYGNEGIIVADYFETRNYLKSLEAFVNMLTEAKDNQYGYAADMCEVILTKTQYDANDKVVKNEQFKVHVHGEEIDL